MRKLIFIASVSFLLTACNSKPAADSQSNPAKDTLTYAFTATYSSDITVPGNPVNAQKVLQVWKMFESMDVNAMKPYFADTINYDDASGMHFHGSADQLLNLAKKDVDGLDSLRFDIAVWESAHINDRNEDWVNIWSTERRYPKNGKPDTVFMQENWQLKEGKVIRFNQYLAKK